MTLEKEIALLTKQIAILKQAQERRGARFRSAEILEELRVALREKLLAVEKMKGG